MPKRLQEGSGPSCGSQSGGPLHRRCPKAGSCPHMSLDLEVLNVNVREMRTRSREGKPLFSEGARVQGGDGTENRGARGTRPARLLEALLQKGRGWGWGRVRGSHGHRFGGVTLQRTGHHHRTPSPTVGPARAPGTQLACGQASRSTTVLPACLLPQRRYLSLSKW